MDLVLQDRYQPYSTDMYLSSFHGLPDEKPQFVAVKSVKTVSDGWDVAFDSGWSLYIPYLSESQKVPVVGDSFTLYGKGIGFPVEGIKHNGKVIFFRNAAQREDRHQRERDAWEQQKLIRFLNEEAKLDAQYEALPLPFKARLDRFRAEDPKFRVDSEAYESFIMQQASLLAQHFKTKDAIDAWEKIGSPPGYDHKSQMEKAPEGWDGGHSGNTHACSIVFAKALLDDIEV